MTICPKCERPIRNGRVRGQFICEYKEEVSGIMHGINVLSEEWLEHEVCSNATEGD